MATEGSGGALRSLLAPPTFADPETTARARSVVWMALTIALTSCSTQLVLLALRPEHALRFLQIGAVVLVICVVDVVAARRGRVTFAAWFQTVAMWALLTAAAWSSGGVSESSITGQLVIVALGGLLVGWKGGLGFAALALATTAALAVAESAGALPAPAYVPSPATHAVIIASYIVVLAVVQLLVMRNLQGARDRAVRELQERRAAEALSDTLIDAAPAIFFMVDASGRRLRWNRRLEEITGRSHAELEARDTLDTVLEEDRPAVMQRIAEAFESGSAEIVARMASPEGVRSVLFTGRRLEAGGEVCVVGFGLDITERLRAEEEVRELNEDLEQRVRERTGQLEDALGALESFSYSVSHDLRGPLRAINGYATILRDDYRGTLGEPGEQLCERIRANTIRMGHLIDDLIGFSRLEHQGLRREAVQTGLLVAGVIADLCAAGEEDGGVDWVVAPLPDVVGDEAMLRQVWANLLANAAKFSAPRAQPRVEVSHSRTGSADEFTVKDNGVGFDPKYADKVFNVFERLHYGADFDGTGIGLAIVKRIVEAHGGRVWCEAWEGSGASFSFSLPLESTGAGA